MSFSSISEWRLSRAVLVTVNELWLVGIGLYRWPFHSVLVDRSAVDRRMRTIRVNIFVEPRGMVTPETYAFVSNHGRGLSCNASC